MQQNQKLTELLNDLIRINNDRIAGYQKAAEDAHEVDMDLLAIFHRMSDESREYATQLKAEVVKLGGDPATGTTASGKIYRAWMNVKVSFTGKDRHSLTTDGFLPMEIRQIIANQKASLKTSHDLIKKYRDMHEAVK